MQVPRVTPNLNQSAVNNPTFGVGARTPFNVSGVTVQAPRSEVTVTHDVKINPGPGQEHFMNGFPLMVINEDLPSKYATVVGLGTLRTLCHGEADRMQVARANANATASGLDSVYSQVGELERVARKRAFDQTMSSDVYSDFARFRQRVRFAGVAYNSPSPYMQTTPYKGDHTKNQRPSDIAVTIRGPTYFPNFVRTRRAFTAGDHIYMIMKPVPLNRTGTHYNLHGRVSRRGETVRNIDNANMTIDIIFVHRPDRTPPPKTTDPEILYANPQQQPPLTNCDYKEFRDPKNPNAYKWRNGLVYYLGFILEPAPANLSADGTDTDPLQDYTDADVNKLPKLRLFLDPRFIA